MRAQASTRALLPVALGLILAAGACLGGSGLPNEDALTAAEETITAEDMAIRVQRLADDEMQGRAPSSPGETTAINYIRDQFEAVALVSGASVDWDDEDLSYYDVDVFAAYSLFGGDRLSGDIMLGYRAVGVDYEYTHDGGKVHTDIDLDGPYLGFKLVF